MKTLAHLIEANETWLVRRILKLAKIHRFTQYTSTLEEAWRLSIQGLSKSLLSALRSFDGPPDFGPDDTFTGDPLTDFGVIEAERHMQRGISLTMFLGLLKYYKQSYIDLLYEEAPADLDKDTSRYFIERSFDRIEIAVCKIWSQCEVSPMIDSLRNTARSMTNEKNAYLTAFESLSDAVVLVDDDGAIFDMNLKALSLLESSSIPGKDYHRLMHTSHSNEQPHMREPGIRHRGEPLVSVFPWLAPVFHSIRGAPDTVSSTVVEAELLGGHRHFEINHSEILDVSGKFAGRVLALRDISERRSMEDKLASRNLELERLRQWESLGMLSTAVAHDFNNLLAVIASRGRFAKKHLRAEDASIAKAVDHILEAVDKGVELTGAMRLCAGQEIRQFALLDLNELVDQWARSMAVALPKSIDLRIVCEGGLPKVPLNREQIFVILTNLFNNAIEAVGEKIGSIIIQTGATNREPAAGYTPAFCHDDSIETYVYLEVSDTGIGIDPAVLPRIFDPFFSTKFIGRGLGLAVVRGAVAAHRGAVRVRSNLNQGSSLKILFPVNPTASQAPPAPRSP